MKNHILKIGMAFSLLLLISNCTDHFKTVNENEYAIPSENILLPAISSQFLFPMLEFALPFSPEQGAEGAWQLIIDLASGNWSGHMATPTPFRGGSNNTTYELVDNWNQAIWNSAYKNIMSNQQQIALAYKENPALKGYYAMSLIIKVFAMQRVTDTFGPIIYSDYGNLSPTVNYDKQEDVYKKFFEEIDEAVKLFNEVKAEELDLSNKAKKLDLSDSDRTLYGGNPDKWIKFANSLRLRLAIRLVKIAPAISEQEVKKALDPKNGGVIETNGDNAIATSPNYTVLGIDIIANSWADTRMSANMDSYLQGYKDPRLSVFFTPVAAIPDDTKERAEIKKKYESVYIARKVENYIGVRSGISIKAKSEREPCSSVGAAISKTNRMIWMTAAEVYFIRAEAALRGWGGDAKTLYESGVQAAFGQYGLSSSAYLADKTSRPIDYIDPIDEKNNGSASELSNVSIAWMNEGDKEKNLEQIMLQKWIALFPNSAEAWSEQRRTGYPKIFKVINNTSNGKIDTNEGVRRINFVQTETQNNSQGVAQAIQFLQTESSAYYGDTGRTRIWWDVANKGNF